MQMKSVNMFACRIICLLFLFKVSLCVCVVMMAEDTFKNKAFDKAEDGLNSQRNVGKTETLNGI